MLCNFLIAMYVFMMATVASAQPTARPTTRQPTAQPTTIPSLAPTVLPTTRTPTALPTTRTPTEAPSCSPTESPTTHKPTEQPTYLPTNIPTYVPTRTPTASPTFYPSSQPSSQPTSKPTNPTSLPSSQPSRQPSSQPSSQPSRIPSSQPSSRPSNQPSSQPTNPTSLPSSQPSRQPSSQPSSQPSRIPSSQPSSRPSNQPSSQPTNPTSLPSSQPTGFPSSQPSSQPSRIPSSQPSSRPSNQPSSQPTNPTSLPSSQPTGFPSSQPSSQPTALPSSLPTGQPSGLPSTSPTSAPSPALVAIITFEVYQTLSISYATFSSNQKENFLALDAAMTAVIDNNAVNVTTKSVASNRRLTQIKAINSRELAGTSVTVTYIVSLIPYHAGMYQGNDYAYNVLKTRISTPSKYSGGSTFLTTLTSHTLSSFTAFTSSSISTPTVASSYSDRILHSAKPTSYPTSMPSCGRGSEGTNANCMPCTPGNYNPHLQPNGGSAQCIPCEVGLFSPGYGAEYCLECPYPYYSPLEGASRCDGVYLKFTFVQGATLVAILVFIFIVCCFQAGDAKYLAIGVMSFPTMDILSDLIYIVGQPFSSKILFVVCVCCFAAPNFIFVWKLWGIGAQPGFFLKYYPGSAFLSEDRIFNKEVGPTIASFWWLSQLPNWKQKVLLFPYQVLTFFPVFVWMVLFSPFYMLLGVLGIWIFQCKVWAISKIWNSWFRLWSGHDPKNYKEVQVDTGILNEALFAEFMVETLPQLVLQAVNNTYLNNWQGVGIFSTVLSISIATNGLYRYGYYSLWLGMRIEDVPTKISIGGLIGLQIASNKQNVGVLAEVEKAKQNPFTTNNMIAFVYEDRSKMLKEKLDMIISMLKTASQGYDLYSLSKKAFFDHLDEKLTEKTNNLRLDKFPVHDIEKFFKYSVDEAAKDTFTSLCLTKRNFEMVDLLMSAGINSVKDIRNFDEFIRTDDEVMKVILDVIDQTDAIADDYLKLKVKTLLAMIKAFNVDHRKALQSGEKLGVAEPLDDTEKSQSSIYDKTIDIDSSKLDGDDVEKIYESNDVDNRAIEMARLGNEGCEKDGGASGDKEDEISPPEKLYASIKMTHTAAP